MKKLLLGGGLSVIAFALCAMPSFAAKPATLPASMPKATGDYGYSIYDVQRYANFNAQKTTKDTCSTSVNLTGSYVFSLYGGAYVHDIELTQTDNVITGTGGYPAGGSYTIHEIINGSVTGNTFIFTGVYAEGGYTYTVEGTVNPLDGTLTITGGSFAGSDWTVTGKATVATSNCDGRGSFNYSDVNGINYKVDIRYVSVDGNKAWFTGPIVSGNFGVGQWIFIKAVDNGEPGIGEDVTAGDFPVTEAQGKYNVATHANPSISTEITSGNIQVHK